MRKTKKLTAAMLAAILAVQGLSAFSPAMAETAEEIKYFGVLGTLNEDDEVVDANAEALEDAWLTNIIDYSNIYDAEETDTIYSFNATELKKVLEIEDGTNIPACNFEFRIAPGEDIPAVFSDNVIQTLQVKAGINPDKIKYNLENVDDNDFVRDDNSDYIPQADSDDDSGLYVLPDSDEYSGFVLEYQPQAVSLPNTGDVAAADDNVLINNVDIDEGYSDTLDTYYAIKTVQMDFSEVGFTEPGIYRYIIMEAESPASILDDVTGVEDEEFSGARTLDVYVEDATYTLDEAGTKQYDLRIAGYVMYKGVVTDAPAANPTLTENDEDLMEDGLEHSNPSGDGSANGAEVAGAEKSEGYRNLYISHDFTMKKTVSGNQGSNDQFFKLTLILTGDFSDEDVFVISPEEGDSTQVVIAEWEEEDDAYPNSATSYTKAEIYAANAAHSFPEDGDIEYKYVTGAELKEGYSFYLQSGQQVKLLGIPEGAAYELREYNEDYKATVTVVGTDGYDDIDGKDGESSAKQIEDVRATTDDAVCITDSYVEGDVSATFNNEKKGTIPTGIIMHVLPVAALATVFGGAVIIFAARRRNDEEE